MPGVDRVMVAYVFTLALASTAAYLAGLERAWLALLEAMIMAPLVTLSILAMRDSRVYAAAALALGLIWALALASLPGG